MRKSSRRRFEGAYREATPEPIDLPYTVENLRTLLAGTASGQSPYTHQQIKDWAAAFWWERRIRPADAGYSVDSITAATCDIAQDIEMQWDMHLANSHSLAQLQTMDFAQIQLPTQWFADWLARLERASETC